MTDQDGEREGKAQRIWRQAMRDLSRSPTPEAIPEPAPKVAPALDRRPLALLRATGAPPPADPDPDAEYLIARSALWAASVRAAGRR